MKTKLFLKTSLPALAVYLAAPAWADTITVGNGFEFDTGGWAGTVPVRTPSGTGGITSSEGSHHAVASAGAFTRWGGYKSDFPTGGISTSVDIYLDVASGAANDTRFCFTSAINTPAGAHLRDFVFNAGFYNDSDVTGSGNRFVISASNGAGRGSAYPKNPARSPQAITVSGWYTFEHTFADVAGVLSVTLNIKNSGGAVVATWTLSEPTDLISDTVGGNRYGWFAQNEFSGGLAIDRTRISSSREASIRNITRSTNHFAISSAQGEADPGNTIRLGAGAYSEGPLTLNKSLTIQGANSGKSGVAGDRSTETRIENSSWTITAPGVVIDGLEIFQTDNTTSPVSVQASNTIVRNSIVRRDGVDAGQFVRGIEISPGLTGYSIDGNLITGSLAGGLFSGHKTWNSGMYVNGGSGSITGNTFENCRSAANLDDFNAGLTVSGNTFRTCGTYLSFGGTTPTEGQCAIAGNEFVIDFNAPSGTLFNNSNVAATFRIDATGNTFGGIPTTALTNPQKFTLEARMYHRGRSGRNGVIDYVANQQVVVAGTTIASAIAAASTGNTVLIGPGTFAENVVTTMPLTIQGSGDSTVIAPASGVGIALAAGTDALNRSVLKELRVPGSTTGITAGSHTTIEGVTSTGHANYGINLNPGQDLIITGCHFDSNNSGLKLASTAGFSDITITGSSFDNNTTHGWYSDAGSAVEPSLDQVSISATSFSGNGMKGFYTERLSNAVFSNITVSGNGNGAAYAWGAGVDVNLKWKDYSSISFLDSTFTNNGIGSANGVALTIKGRDDGASYGANPATLNGVTVTNCSFNSNERHYVSGEPAKGNAGPTGVVISQCNFTDAVVAAVVNHTLSPLASTHCYWDAPSGPTHTSNPTGSGETISDGASYSPWYADAARTILVTHANFSNTTIPEGASVTKTDLYIGTGSTYTVNGNLEVTGDLNLADGAILTVNGGELDLGNGSVISGTFTIFNSFGSWDINGNVTFTIGQSLALISEIHVAAGKTLTVNGGGKLILDGCSIDSQTPGSQYNIAVATDGLLTVARTVVTDANIDINSTAALPLRSQIYDSSFVNSDIEAGAGSRVYHNLFDSVTDSAANTDATIAFDDVDNWGNVTSVGDLKNRYALTYATPGDVSRTLDSAGNLFVQPTDPVVVKLGIGSLDGHTVTGAEALLGYSSDFLALQSTTPAVAEATGWDVIVDDDAVTGSLGTVDSALGLELVGPGNDGIAGPADLASVSFNVKPGVQGQTANFFRVQTNGSYIPATTDFMQDTRLTKSVSGVPSYLAAFTENTGDLIVDDQDPAITVPATSGTQVQPTYGTVNVLDPLNYVIRDGTPVILTFSAADAGLAGLDAADATADLALTATNGTSILAYTVAAVEAPLTGVVTYTVTIIVPATATVGTYPVTATVRDRSGNVSALAALGSFQIANEVLATVELESFVGGTRSVLFTATNGAGEELASWTKNVVFAGPSGTVPLEAVPVGTAAISAKTAWNLRSKLAVSFSNEGVGAVSLTGTDRLPGGDLNGDNVVNTLDYSILRYNYTTTNPVANINGDAVVNLTDYLIQKGNFYTAGDAE